MSKQRPVVLVRRAVRLGRIASSRAVGIDCSPLSFADIEHFRVKVDWTRQGL
jgi:hypothetical protein